MNRQRVARAYEIISEGYAELARAYADEQPAAGDVPPRAPAPAPTIAEIERAAGAPLEPLERANDRAQSVKEWEYCPKHRKPWTEGRYGPYCASTSDEPDWANQKGYCNIKPSSAAAYARKHNLAA